MILGTSHSTGILKYCSEKLNRACCSNYLTWMKPSSCSETDSQCSVCPTMVMLVNVALPISLFLIWLQSRSWPGHLNQNVHNWSLPAIFFFSVCDKHRTRLLEKLSIHKSSWNYQILIKNVLQKCWIISKIKALYISNWSPNITRRFNNMEFDFCMHSSVRNKTVIITLSLIPYRCCKIKSLRIGYLWDRKDNMKNKHSIRSSEFDELK